MSIFSNLKWFLLAFAVLLVGGWGYSKHRAIEKLEVERDRAIVQRDSAAAQRDKAIQAAKDNALVVDTLKQEKADINTALNALASAQATNRTNTITREVIIQNQAADPLNSGQAAPVIKAIIAEVQEDRDERRKR